MSHIDYFSDWVITNFHFRVTIDGTELSFQEVSGLETSAEVVEYRGGDEDPTQPTHKRLGLVKTSELTFKKGVFRSDDHLLEMFNEVYDKHYMSTADGRKEILVELLDEQGDAVMTWNVINAIPTKLGGVTLKSDANEAAIEEITFVHEGVTVAIG